MDGGYHLLELINGILNLSRIESGKISLSIEILDIEPLLDKCLNLIQPQALDREIKVIKKYNDLDCGIFADYTRLQQVFLNLLSNAIKYNETGDTVTVECNEIISGLLKISIIDNGLGIALNKHDELFQSFNRLGVETADIEGTGIGLTVTKNLVELIGGQIGFESEAKKGSTFWIEFPLVNDQAFKNKSAKESFNNNDSFAIPEITGSLLYIEDNPSNLRLMEKLIAKVNDLSMFSATSAEKGIEIALTEQPDIISLDNRKPGNRN